MKNEGDRGELAPESVARPAAARVPEPAPQEARWLQRYRVELPDPIEGYIRRTEVEQRCALLEHRLTVLCAPGGFGKTALLGERCRELRRRGVAVAWLSLEEEDGRGSVAAYLALAFERAGVATFDSAEQRAAPTGSGGAESDRAADSQAEYRLNLLFRALERHGAPCVLALDEVERLHSPEAVAVINALLRHAPPTLHVGMAFRERPPGLDIAMFALEGRGGTVGAEDLRFSARDVSRFFERRLSRRELATVVADSAGWPIALRMYRNAGRHGAASAGAGDDTVAGWIETRLWRGISAEDRDFVLDVALFDEVAPELIDEVTGAGNAARRLASLRALAGLWSTTAGPRSAMRLHPLIKDHCEKRRFEEDPQRYRAIHRGIALALARRGRAVEALRHALEASDAELLGPIAEGAGGVRLWLEQGLDALRAVDGLLSEQVLANYPRLALAHCIVLTASGDVGATKRAYQAASAATAGFTRDRAGGDDRALQIDHFFVVGQQYLCGCMPFSDGTLPIAGAKTIADAPGTDPLLRGLFSLGVCIYYHHVTAFDQSIEWAGRARAALRRGSPYQAHVDFHAGSVAMAMGRPQEARDCYQRALKAARASHLRDAGAVMIGEVLAAELELECSAGVPRVAGARLTPRLLGECGAWLDIYAASIGGEVELALVRGNPQEALRLVEDAREYALRTERPGLTRWLAALRVSVLLAAGDVEEASRAWRFDRLPEQAAACTDLQGQTWREAEMLACARLRLFIARGEFDAARELAAALHAIAAECGLMRTRMRGLALATVLEHQAGDEDRARAHLEEFLRLFAGADYGWPLARERAPSAHALLDDIAAGDCADVAVVQAAATLRAAMNRDADAVPDRPLSKREFDVLERLERYRDKEIAWDLKLSYDGVRYRVRSIFAKLGARGRLDAVHRARARGILPPYEDVSEARSSRSES